MTQQKPVLLEGRKKVCYVPEDMERRAKGPDAIVLMSVWSNPYISEIGVTQNAVANIARYTSMSESDVDAALRRLDKAKEVVFDSETQEVMAPEWIQYNFDEEDDDSTADEEAPDLTGMPYSQTLRDYYAGKKEDHLFRTEFWLQTLDDSLLGQMIKAVREAPTSDLVLLGLSLITAESGKEKFRGEEISGAVYSLAQVLICEQLRRDGLIQVKGPIQITEPLIVRFTPKGMEAKANAQPGDLLAEIGERMLH